MEKIINRLCDLLAAQGASPDRAAVRKFVAARVTQVAARLGISERWALEHYLTEDVLRDWTRQIIGTDLLVMP